jgi:GGDEF domain-containing protein
VAERLRTAVKLAPIKDVNNNLLPSVTISIGGAVLSATHATTPALVAAADANLYASKQNGRDRVTM